MNEGRARAVLAERRARLLQSRDPSIYPDGTITRYWVNIPADMVDDCVLYLEKFSSAKNSGKAQSYVTDPLVGGRKRTGVWRSVSIDTREEKSRSFTILQTIAEGFRTTIQGEVADSIDFSGARLVRDKKLLGNGETAGVDNTTSSSPERYLLVRFTAISPNHCNAIMTEISQATYTAPTIRGETYAGDWKLIYATHEDAEDGSKTIDMLLARPQYTLNAYQDVGGTAERGVTYVWNVPKDIAQTILNDYEDTGRSATASYNKDSGLVDLILSTKAGIPTNLSINDVNLNCDTTASYHYGWGYTEAQLSSFVASHNTPEEGVTRTVKTDDRGDGLFDITIVETTFGPHASYIDYQISLPTGDSYIVRTQYYGWNLRKSELTSVKSTFDTTVKAVGRTIEFQVTREDDCSFDYVAIITNVTAFETMLEIASGADTGVAVKTYAGIHSDPTALPATVTDTAQPREEINVDLNPQPDGTVGYKVVRKTEQEVNTSKEIAASGAEGEAVTSYAGKNASIANLAAILNSVGARERVTISLNPKGNGLVDYEIVKRTAQAATAEVESAIGAQGLGTRIKTGANISVPDLTALLSDYTSAARKRINFNLVGNDDGTVNVLAEETTVQKVEKTDLLYGQKHRIVSTRIGKNVDDADVPVSGSPPAAGTTIRQRVSGNDDYTFDHETETETVTEKSAQSRRYTAKLTQVSDRTSNAASQDASTGETGKIIDVKQEADDNGFFEIQKDTFTPVALTSDAVVIYNDGIVSKSVTLYFNQSSAPVATAGVEIIQPELNDFGLYDYIAITTTILVSSLIIVAQAVTQEERSPIRTRFQTGVLDAYEFQRYRDVTQTITRYFYASKQAPPSATSSKTVSNQYRAGYDDKRGVYFIDHDYKTFTAWYDAELIHLPPLSV